MERERITNNFFLDEFQSKCGMTMPENVKINITKLAINLQVLRGYLNSPITVTSGYRSVQHNFKIKGAVNSTHIIGKACDIKVKGYSPKEVFNAIELLISKGRMAQGGLKAYSNWVHYDIRGVKARW